MFCVCAVAITQGGAIQLAGPGGEALQGVQALTLPSPATPQPGATILQYGPQPGDPGQQLLLSAGQVLVQGKTLELLWTSLKALIWTTSLLKSVRQKEVKNLLQNVKIVVISAKCVYELLADSRPWSWKDNKYTRCIVGI